MKDPIELVPVTRDNWYDCVELQLAPSQVGNLASNLKTIAESAFEPHYELRAIMLEKRIIGMLAYCPEVDEPIEGLYWLFRIMVDKSHQGRGYGKAAIELSIKEMLERGASQIRTMCRVDNYAAEKCYLSLGFSKIGLLDDGDMVFELSQPTAGGAARSRPHL